MKIRIFGYYVFTICEKQQQKNEENIDAEMLYAQIGQLKVENAFSKKVAGNWEYEIVYAGVQL